MYIMLGLLRDKEIKKMRELMDFTVKDITDYLINDIAEDYNITKALAKKLFINAISYNVVISSIKEQIDYLLEDNE